MKRRPFALFVTSAVVLVAGCGSSADIWHDEFVARLEGASGTVEEARAEVVRGLTPIQYDTVLGPLAKRLFFKSELIKELDPPASCEAVQVKGGAAVDGGASLLGGAFKNMTPYLERRLPAILGEEVAKLEELEREAETCA